MTDREFLDSFQAYINGPSLEVRLAPRGPEGAYYTRAFAQQCHNTLRQRLLLIECGVGDELNPLERLALYVIAAQLGAKFPKR